MLKGDHRGPTYATAGSSPLRAGVTGTFRLPPLVAHSPCLKRTCPRVCPRDMSVAACENRRVGYTVFHAGELDWQPRRPGDPRLAAELSGAMTQSRANLFRYPPGAVGRRHIDPMQEEVFVVMAGTLTIHMGEGDAAGGARARARAASSSSSRGRRCSSRTGTRTSCASSSSEPRRSAARRSSSIRSDGRATRRRSRRRDRCSRSAGACLRGYDARSVGLDVCGRRRLGQLLELEPVVLDPSDDVVSSATSASIAFSIPALRQDDPDVRRSSRHLERHRGGQVEGELRRHRLLSPATLLVHPDLDGVAVESLRGSRSSASPQSREPPRPEPQAGVSTCRGWSVPRNAGAGQDARVAARRMISSEQRSAAGWRGSDRPRPGRVVRSCGLGAVRAVVGQVAIDRVRLRWSCGW